MELNDPRLIYAILLVLVALILLLIGLIVFYLRLVNKYLALKEGREEDIEPQAVLADAQKKAQNIIEDAHQEAKNIINSAEEYKNAQDQKIAEELGKTTQVFANKYQEALNTVQEKSVNMFKGISEDIKSSVNEEMKTFKGTLMAEIARIQSEERESIRSVYQSVREEIAKYKQQRMQEVDENIVKMVEEVTRKVVAREVTTEEHEKLVMKALEEAKRQNII